MNFCPDCENYLTTRIVSGSGTNKSQSLEYFCRNCGYTEEKSNTTSKCVYKNEYDLQKIYIQDKNIKYICDDPAIPRVNNITCPNKDCISHKDDSGLGNDVRYLKINEEDMKYLYLCCHCEYKWTNE